MNGTLIARLDEGMVTALLDRLGEMQVTVEQRGRLLRTRGPEGHHSDRVVQSLVARVQGLYAEFPDEVMSLVRRHRR